MASADIISVDWILFFLRITHFLRIIKDLISCFHERCVCLH